MAFKPVERHDRTVVVRDIDTNSERVYCTEGVEYWVKLINSILKPYYNL